jgi:hypothetical protein
MSPRSENIFGAGGALVFGALLTPAVQSAHRIPIASFTHAWHEGHFQRNVVAAVRCGSTILVFRIYLVEHLRG